MSNIRIDGEFFEVEHTYANIVREGGARYTLFATRDMAGEEAREYWRDMAENDPTEFRHMVGDETLVKWALGQYAGAGSTKVSSLSEWLDLWLDTPEEHFASYDGVERDVEPPTVDEKARAGFISRLGHALEAGEWQSDTGCEEAASAFSAVGIDLDGKTYWLMDVGFKGAHGTRFSAEPAGDAIESKLADLREALDEDEVANFVNGWEQLVDELGFTPGVAYRSN